MPIKPKVQPSKLESGSASKVVGSTISTMATAGMGSNKFNLNLSGVRKIAGQTKVSGGAVSGREKESFEVHGGGGAANISSTLYSERRRHVAAPTTTTVLNKLSSSNKGGGGTAKYIQEKKLGPHKDDSLREDSNPSISLNHKKRPEISSALASRTKK